MNLFLGIVLIVSGMVLSGNYLYNEIYQEGLKNGSPKIGYQKVTCRAESCKFLIDGDEIIIVEPDLQMRAEKSVTLNQSNGDGSHRVYKSVSDENTITPASFLKAIPKNKRTRK